MSATAAQDIVVERPADAVACITLNRPQVRNALRTQTLREIAAELTSLAGDDAIRAVVVTGGAQFFAAGADVREMQSLGPIELLTHERQRHWQTIATFPKPLIGAVCGFALGGGCELVQCCDFTVAGTNAQFGQPEVNLGLIPGAGGMGRLTRIVGKPLAMRMVLTGQPIDAEVALAAGLIAEIQAPEHVLARALELAAVVAAKPPLAVRLAKASVLRALDVSLTEALSAERQAFAVLAASEDRREGIAAFLDKRPAKFTGR